MDPVDLSEHGTYLEEQDDHEILFLSRTRNAMEPPTIASESTGGHGLRDHQYGENIKRGCIRRLRIQRAYQQLSAENVARDKALTDLTAMDREYGSSPVTTQSNPRIQADVLDGDGNLRAADIGITWEVNETFLHGVRVVGSNFP